MGRTVCSNHVGAFSKRPQSALCQTYHGRTHVEAKVRGTGRQIAQKFSRKSTRPTSELDYSLALPELQVCDQVI